MDDTKLKKLEQINSLLQEGAPSQEELAAIFSAILKSFKEAVNAMEERVVNGERGILQKQQELVRKGEEVMEKWEHLSSLEAGHSKVSQELEMELSKITALYDNLKTIKASDIASEAVDLVERKLKPLIPRLNEIEDIVKENLLPEKTAIKSLEEKLDKLRRETKKTLSNIPRGGGTSAIGVAQAFKYILKTEEPTGDIDGVNTTYTVTQPIFAILSMSLNGETIAQLPNYTINGKTITFSTALPAAYSGKDFEIKYI